MLSGYTCPVLMGIQYVMMRLRPPLGTFYPVRIRGGRVVYVMPKGHGVEVRPWWPTWLILAECRLQNWLAVWRAKKGAGR